MALIQGKVFHKGYYYGQRHNDYPDRPVWIELSDDEARGLSKVEFYPSAYVLHYTNGRPEKDFMYDDDYDECDAVTDIDDREGNTNRYIVEGWEYHITYEDGRGSWSQHQHHRG